ncbi:hypothetical protein [Paenibacillus sp. HJGM_3]|uniref:hypothetical protein n=1 Tax=Paenibacillus sp. HJGM_3 TaxID=3379816 RepID=UPI00385EA791
MEAATNSKILELSKLEDKNFLAIAIKTELHLNKHRMHLLMDYRNNQEFIKEFADNISRRMQNYKEITEFVLQSEAEQHQHYI